MKMPERSVYRFFQIDTNRINSSGKLEAMNQLERWAADGVIQIDMSATAQNEAAAGGGGPRTEKAYGYIFSETMANTPEEQTQLRKIEEILFPGGCSNQNQRNDLDIVFNALKYTRILVTNDGASRSQPGGILGHATELQELGVRVMRDTEAVAFVEEWIRERDEIARRVSRETGEALPEWVGSD